MTKEYFPVGALGAVAAVLGLGTPLVGFVAASAFETPGTTSTLEVSAMCIAIALYLAFCQFWVAPRGRGRFWAKLLTVVALIAPAQAGRPPSAQLIPWLASVCLGSVVGALIAHGLTAWPQREAPGDDAINRGRRSRRYLLAGFILLGAMALVILIGVIPSVLADTTPGFGARESGVFLGVTVVFDLLAAALLAFALWRRREDALFSKGILGSAAFVAVLVGLLYCGFGVLVGGHGTPPPISSVLLLLCAAFGLITTALMIVTSVIVDRARLCAETCSGLQPAANKWGIMDRKRWLMTVCTILLAAAAVIGVTMVKKTPFRTNTTPTLARLTAGEFLDPRDGAAMLKLEGQTVKVKGRIVRFATATKGTYYYLNFADDFRTSLSLTFRRDDNPTEFRPELLQPFCNKVVVVNGTVTTFSGRPQILIKSLSEIQVQAASRDGH